MIKELRFQIEKLAFFILRKTRQKGVLMLSTVDVEPELWEKCYHKGRVTMMWDFNIVGKNRQVMMGELVNTNVTHQEFVDLQEKFREKQS